MSLALITPAAQQPALSGHSSPGLRNEQNLQLRAAVKRLGVGSLLCWPYVCRGCRLQPGRRGDACPRWGWKVSKRPRAGPERTLAPLLCLPRCAPVCPSTRCPACAAAAMRRSRSSTCLPRRWSWCLAAWTAWKTSACCAWSASGAAPAWKAESWLSWKEEGTWHSRTWHSHWPASSSLDARMDGEARRRRRGGARSGRQWRCQQRQGRGGGGSPRRGRSGRVPAVSHGHR